MQLAITKIVLPECITRLQTLVADVQRLVTSNGLPIDLQPLLQAMSTMRVPGGWSKLVASALVFPRNMHRSWTVKRVENLRKIVNNIQNTLWQSQRQRSNDRSSAPNYSVVA